MVSAAVDGGWSRWTAWSICGSDCTHTRRRSCDEPAPSPGGRGCKGKDVDVANCTGGLCNGKYLDMNDERSRPFNIYRLTKNKKGSSVSFIHRLAFALKTKLFFFLQSTAPKSAVPTSPRRVSALLHLSSFLSQSDSAQVSTTTLSRPPLRLPLAFISFISSLREDPSSFFFCDGEEPVTRRPAFTRSAYNFSSSERGFAMIS